VIGIFSLELKNNFKIEGQFLSNRLLHRMHFSGTHDLKEKATFKIVL